MKATATFSLLITSVLASPLLVERRQDPMELHEEHGSSGGGNDNIISGFFGQIRGLVGSTTKTFSQITGFDLGSDTESYDAESSRESDKDSEPGGGHSHGSGDEYGHSSKGGHGSGGHGSSSGGGHGASESEDESISFGVEASDYGSERGYGSRSGGGHGARKPKDESLGFDGDVAKHSSGAHAPSGGPSHGIDGSFSAAAGSDFDPDITNDTEDNYSISGRGAGSRNGNSGHGKSHMSASPSYGTTRGKDGYGKTNKRTAQVRSASANDDDLFNDESEFDTRTKSLDNGDDFEDSSSHKEGEDSQPEQSGGFFSSIGLGPFPILGQY